MDWARELQFIAQAGLTYSRDVFDRERFARIQELAAEIAAEGSGESLERVRDIFTAQTGYQTPKLDTRAAIFKEDRILLVQEAADGKWALPGGWVDATQTIQSNTVKECREESGYLVRPLRLIALQEQQIHNRPADFFHICKAFVLCEIIGGVVSGKRGDLTNRLVFEG